MSSLIIGLGNPGKKYAFTRHNVGFIFVDKFLKKYPPFETVQKVDYLLYSTIAEGLEISLVKPLTFMNQSGLIFNSLYVIDPPLVVYDDLDLEIGKMRIRPSGSAGGHNGVKSIIEHLETQNFPRIRIGIGPKNSDAIEYVLGRFSDEEFAIVDRVIDHAIEAAIVIFKDGIDVAMNRFNSLKLS
ncbi:aminoacyl-tRNA hydrolase [Athalassotoga sp.]|uniref:aminoacyl-tRNA hydrolase n=1 Tax=Athalassotoga sp. TaxID=2022597 RepID=UPI003D014925